MYKEAMRPACVEISLDNLEHNVKQIIEKVGSAEKITGVIKADAYGHGAVKITEVLRKCGIKTFATATLAEAVKLRECGAREEIIVLGLIPNMYADIVAEYGLTVVCCDSENARAFSDAAEAMQKRAAAQQPVPNCLSAQDAFSGARPISALIAVDTGMGRIGYLADDPDTAIADIKKMLALPNFRITGLFSHMSTADEADKTFSREQERKYNAFYGALKNAGIAIPLRTLANSASVTELPSVNFDLVRPGIILYGCYPSGEVDRSLIDLRPVMSVRANIVHLKDVPEGFSVSYGRSFIAKRPSKIATIELGYSDGYPRPYSKHAKVIVNGKLAPIAGNICMDQCMIDVTDVPGVKLGDEVIIMGSDGTLTISADDIAAATGTINYEILCAFGQRLPKVYL